MNDALNTLFSNWIVVGILVIGVASMIDTVAKQVRKYACHCQDVAFKREMVDRGLAIDEIERLVHTSSVHDADSTKCS